jgi:hypothetical protein
LRKKIRKQGLIPFEAFFRTKAAKGAKAAAQEDSFVIQSTAKNLCCFVTFALFCNEIFATLVLAPVTCNDWREMNSRKINAIRLGVLIFALIVL